MPQSFSLDAPGLPSTLIASLVEEAELVGAGRLALVGGVVRDLMLYRVLREPWRQLADLDLLLEGSSFDFVGHLQAAAIANFLRDVSVGRLQGAVTASDLAVVSVGRAQCAATANFLNDVSVKRLQGAAMANFLADVSVGH